MAADVIAGTGVTLWLLGLLGIGIDDKVLEKSLRPAIYVALTGVALMVIGAVMVSHTGSRL